MPELNEQQLQAVQVIEEHDTFIRVYTIESMHEGDQNDPLTTIHLTGEYQDVPFGDLTNKEVKEDE